MIGTDRDLYNKEEKSSILLWALCQLRLKKWINMIFSWSSENKPSPIIVNPLKFLHRFIGVDQKEKKEAIKLREYQWTQVF